MVNCATQAELDRCWKKLTSGRGKEVQCGWRKDKYGPAWPTVPKILSELAADKDLAKANRVMQVVMKSVKLDIKKLKQAEANRS